MYSISLHCFLAVTSGDEMCLMLGKLERPAEQRQGQPGGPTE